MKGKKEQKKRNGAQNGKKSIAATQAAKTQKQDAKPKHTIKQAVIETITANSAVTNEEMIATVKSQFPKSAFKDSHAA